MGDAHIEGLYATFTSMVARSLAASAQPADMVYDENVGFTIIDYTHRDPLPPYVTADNLMRRVAAWSLTRIETEHWFTVFHNDTPDLARLQRSSNLGHRILEICPGSSDLRMQQTLRDTDLKLQWLAENFT